MGIFTRYNSITAEQRFLARANDGTTVNVNAGETFKQQDVRETESGQMVHFAVPKAGLVLAISESPEGKKPWRLSRV